MGLYAASEQVQVSKSVLHEFSQEYHKHAHARAHTHTHTHTHKPFYFEHHTSEGSEASHQYVRWLTAHLMVFLQQLWWSTPPATLPAPKLATSHGTSARELASSWSETEGPEPDSWVVLQSAEDGRDPHSQYLCIEHTAEDRAGCDPEARSWQNQECGQPAHLPGWWWLTAFNTTLLFSILMPSRYRAEASTGVP